MFIVRTIDSFLLSSKLLFESFIWEPEEVICMSNIYNAVEFVTSIPDDIENKEVYLNDAMGEICNLVKETDNLQEIKIFNK